MARFLVALPVPPRLRAEGPEATEEVETRMGEFVGSRQRLGVTRERGWVQSTPAGDVFLLMLEGQDPVDSNRRFAASQEPFDVWFKDRFGTLMNADFNQPIPVQPQLIYRSVPEDREAEQSVAVAIPLVPGKTEVHKAMAEEVKGSRREAFDGFHARAGVTEDWWIEPTPNGDLVLLYLESDDLAGAMAHLAQSQEETEVWFKKTLLETEGIDWGAPPPPLPELLFDWRV
jgi:hypothetical protein